MYILKNVDDSERQSPRRYSISIYEINLDITIQNLARSDHLIYIADVTKRRRNIRVLCTWCFVLWWGRI